ncbi:hypothetical protein [Rhizobium giardinii]|uniref:hypothetical protein n=1 Tax=Rhizobium giardinii TaxID=56731 RepID=UPI003D6F7367
MGRKSDGIRAWYDETAKKWHIRDPDPNAPKNKWSLGFGKEKPDSELLAWKAVDKYKAEKEAGGRLNLQRQSTADVRVSDVIAFYADRRINNFIPDDDYKHPLTRIDDVKIRLRVLLDFFQDLPLDSITRLKCQDFGKFVHNREIERARKLYDRQVEIYEEKLEAYQKKVTAREKFIADMASRGRSRVLPELRSKPPAEMEPFNAALFPYRRSAARRYLEELSAAVTFAVCYELVKHKVVIPLPPKYDARSSMLSLSEIRRLIKTAWHSKGMGWIDGKPVKGLYVRRHLARFIFLSITTGSRKDKVERVSFKNEGDRPWIDLWQEHDEAGELVWKGRYHRLGDDEVEHENKRAPSLPIAQAAVKRLVKWRDEGIVSPCAHPYAASGRDEPGNVKDGMRALFDEVLGQDNDAVIHTLRHTAATWMCAQKDLPLPSIAAYLGMTTETLVKTYAHHREEDLNKIADAVFDSDRDTHKVKLRETKRKPTENARQKSTVIDRMGMKRSA